MREFCSCLGKEVGFLSWEGNEIVLFLCLEGSEGVLFIFCEVKVF